MARTNIFQHGSVSAKSWNQPRRRLSTDKLLCFAIKGVVKTSLLWTESSRVNKRDIGEEYFEHLYLSQPPSAA